MGDQLRYNTGKAKLTYIESAHRAINDLEQLFNSNAGGQIRTVFGRGYMVHVRRYLAGGPRSELLIGLARLLQTGEWILRGEPILGRVGRLTVNSFPAMRAEFLKVCEYGESKYARGNYRKGAPVSNYLDSFCRHEDLLQRGENNDKDAEELGFSTTHYGHMFWNLVMALDQPDVRDDRLPPVQFGEFDPNRLRGANDVLVGWAALDADDELELAVEFEIDTEEFSDDGFYDVAGEYQDPKVLIPCTFVDVTTNANLQPGPDEFFIDDQGGNFIDAAGPDITCHFFDVERGFDMTTPENGLDGIPNQGTRACFEVFFDEDRDLVV